MKKKTQTTLKTPLFWDLHIHGVAGVDFMSATEDEMLLACEVLGAHGIGAFAPTLLTANLPLLTSACEKWGKFIHSFQSKRHPNAAIPLGLHLEGPFLSAKMAGAHPLPSLLLPSLKIFHSLQKAAQNKIAILTLAPELKGAFKLIEYASKQGVRVQIGHTQAEPAIVQQACSCGATGVTHLYNAMYIHHRSPGVLPALQQKQLTAEVISDGIHLNTEMLSFLWNALSSQLYAVTDACSALNAGKSKRPLTLGDIFLEQKKGAAYVKGTDILAGGASFLTEHPFKLKKAFQSNEQAFELFYKVPAQLYSRLSKSLANRQNLFDSKTWKYLGTSNT